MKTLFIVVLTGAFWLHPLLAAEEAPTITISKSDVVAIAVSPIGGANGASVTKIVQNDLAVSGYFNVTSAGSAGLIVSGDSSGSGLQGKVVDHSGKVALSSNYSGSARAKAHEFANDIIRTLTGNPGIAGTKIAFVSTKSGKKEIYTADYDGSNVQQLTRDNSISVGPSLSADGRKLAYTGYKSGYADIYVIDLGSGSRERAIKFPGTNSGAAFSPDGARIACSVSRDGNPELYVCGVGGGGARRLTHSPGVESAPTWSPDGGEIIYSYEEHGPQLYRISASGGSGRQIPTGHGYCTEPDWSPDGKKVAFNVREGGSFAVAVLDLQGGQTRVLANGESPAWGADSRHIIYASGGALYLLDAQSGRKVKVLDGLGKITEPAWAR
ncbi:MAG: TolB protein [Chthoniobacter sp.]|nr:TolB protein [Chthoniobacter sp.]